MMPNIYRTFTLLQPKFIVNSTLEAIYLPNECDRSGSNLTEYYRTTVPQAA